VTKLHALQIIKKFFDKIRSKNQPEMKINSGIKTMIANQSQDEDIESQNLNDTVTNKESKESHRRLFEPVKSRKK